MNKTLKASGVVLLGCIIWSFLSYIAIAFLKAETNPFIWSISERGGFTAFHILLCSFQPRDDNCFKGGNVVLAYNDTQIYLGFLIFIYKTKL
jgi:hypothetical protein